jgi:hypothetical protein
MFSKRKVAEFVAAERGLVLRSGSGYGDTTLVDGDHQLHVRLLGDAT